MDFVLSSFTAGASEADKALFRAKIAFHGNRVPPHENIVRLVGVIDEGRVFCYPDHHLLLFQYLIKHNALFKHDAL